MFEGVVKRGNSTICVDRWSNYYCLKYFQNINTLVSITTLKFLPVGKGNYRLVEKRLISVMDT